MAKKKHKHGHKKFRNAAPSASRGGREPRPKGGNKPKDETPLRRLGYTAAGAAGTALIGSFLATQGWAPKTIAGVLSAVGAGLAWRGDDPTVRSIGAGTMSAAGSQLALMLIDDRDAPKTATPPPSKEAKKPANSDELPPGALESAFERARMRLALSSDALDAEV